MMVHVRKDREICLRQVQGTWHVICQGQFDRIFSSNVADHVGAAQLNLRVGDSSGCERTATFTVIS